MLRKDLILAISNEKVCRSLISSSHSLFNHGKMVPAKPSKKRKAFEVEAETENHRTARRLFEEIAAIDIRSPHWLEAALRIRMQLEGKELDLIDVVINHGYNLIHKLGLKIISGQPVNTHSLREVDMVRKLCLIFHPDKWRTSAYSSQVFIAMQRWAIDAKEMLEGYCEHMQQNAAILNELREYISKTHDHLHKSGEFGYTLRRC